MKQHTHLTTSSINFNSLRATDGITLSLHADSFLCRLQNKAVCSLALCVFKFRIFYKGIAERLLFFNGPFHLGLLKWAHYGSMLCIITKLQKYKSTLIHNSLDILIHVSMLQNGPVVMFKNFLISIYLSVSFNLMQYWVSI